MSEYHQLSTEKYVNAAQQAEAIAIRQQQRKETFQAMVLFAFGVTVLGMTMLAVYTMPNWLPSVGSYLENWGILNG